VAKKNKDKEAFFMLGTCGHCKKLVVIDSNNYPSGGQPCPFDGTIVDDFAYVDEASLTAIIRMIAEKLVLAKGE
jgi:hypothetical protein